MRPEAAAETLRDRVAALPQRPGRRLVALAGPPGSGKSTLAEALAQALGPEAALVSMDGFHLDNRILDARGLRHRKGAPETFDAAGFAAAVARLASENEVILPIFDRTRDIAIAGSVAIEPHHQLVVIEGNYLLFDAPVWRDLRRRWDLSVWLDVPEPVLRARLIERWREHGLDAAAAEVRAEENDLPNAHRMLAARLPADIVIAATGD